MRHLLWFGSLSGLSFSMNEAASLSANRMSTQHTSL